jgi:hypothetical protein
MNLESEKLGTLIIRALKRAWVSQELNLSSFAKNLLPLAVCITVCLPSQPSSPFVITFSLIPVHSPLDYKLPEGRDWVCSPV